MTYAEPPGNWSLRKSAVASADVQIADSGTDRPDRANRADRSRGVKIELLVRTRKGRFFSTSRCRNSAAPGRARSSWTRTPSISVSQQWRADLTRLVCQFRSVGSGLRDNQGAEVRYVR